MERPKKTAPKGYIYRSKTNSENFASELYVEVGLNVEDLYDVVPMSVFEDYLTKNIPGIEI